MGTLCFYEQNVRVHFLLISRVYQSVQLLLLYSSSKKTKTEKKTQKQNELYIKTSENVSSLLLQHIPFSIDRTGVKKGKRNQARKEQTIRKGNKKRKRMEFI